MTLHPHTVTNERDLRTDYTLHAAIAAATEHAPHRVLWRRDGHLITINTPLRPTPPGWLPQPATPNQPPRNGAPVTLDAWLNPTVTRNRKRHALTTDTDRRAWAHRQAARLGVEIETIVILAERAITGTREGTGRLTLIAVHYQLTGRVRDTDALRTAISAGLGPGKAFGLGLITVR